MSNPRYNIKWVGRCTYGTSDKVWGWFYYNDPTQPRNNTQTVAYTFWAATGKAVSFKRHEDIGDWHMNRLAKKKVERNYVEITRDQFEEIWPDIYNDFDYKFIFNLLAENI